MRIRVTLAILMATTSAAFAGGGFDIVIPGRPGVPIIINGVDASYSVVEGVWGLGQGNQVQPTIYGGRYIDPVPRVGHYYPSAGRMPGYGRLEIEPPANRRCRSRPRAITSHGRRSRRRCRRSPTYPSIRPQSSTRRRMIGADRPIFHADKIKPTKNTYRRE